MINAVGSKGSTIWNNSARAAGASCGRCKRQPSRARLRRAPGRSVFLILGHEEGREFLLRTTARVEKSLRRLSNIGPVVRRMRRVP